jgi:transcriptional regulator with XRE-family HTH domain
VSDAAQARVLRRELGQRLKGLREAAGLSQQQVARRVGYTRSAVSNAESGGHARRRFWELCDELFGAAPTLASGYDQIYPRPAAPPPAPGPERDDGMTGLELLLAAQETSSPAQALAGYQKLGWPTEQHDGKLVLMTGTVIDALEVPRPAGMLAADWWLFTGGAADQVRGLPALPRPDQALAAIDTGDSLFFLASSHGTDPRRDNCLTSTIVAAPATPGPPAVRWHSQGSHIPVPPSPAGPGRTAVWAHLPSARLRLVAPVGLLDLLAKAVAATGPGAGRLVLPGGVLVLPVPANQSPPVQWPTSANIARHSP